MKRNLKSYKSFKENGRRRERSTNLTTWPKVATMEYDPRKPIGYERALRRGVW